MSGFPRRAFPSALTNLIDNSGPELSIESVVLHRDFTPTWRSATAKIVDFFVHDDGKEGRLPEVCEYLFSPTSDQFRSPNCAKIGSALCGIFDGVSPTFLGRLVNCPYFIDRLKLFLATKESMENPIFSGRFQKIYFKLWRRLGGEIEREFPDFLQSILPYTHLLGWQEALSCLIAEFPHHMGCHGDPLEAHRLIALTAKELADQSKSDPKLFVRLQGIYSAVANTLQQSKEEAFQFVADLKCVEYWTDSIIFLVFVDNPNLRAIADGVRCIRCILKLCRKFSEDPKTENVQKFIKTVSLNLAQRLQVDKIDWEKVANDWDNGQTVDQRVELFFILFSVFWGNLIGPMNPLLFCMREISGEFCRIYMKVLSLWISDGEASRSTELLEFLSEFHVTERLMIILPKFGLKLNARYITELGEIEFVPISGGIPLNLKILDFWKLVSNEYTKRKVYHGPDREPDIDPVPESLPLDTSDYWRTETNNPFWDVVYNALQKLPFIESESEPT
jgi:hypothetical protein